MSLKQKVETKLDACVDEMIPFHYNIAYKLALAYKILVLLSKSYFLFALPLLILKTNTIQMNQLAEFVFGILFFMYGFDLIRKSSKEIHNIWVWYDGLKR